MHDKPVALQKVYGTISYRNEGEPENEDSWRDRPIAIYLDFTKLNYCEDNGGEVSDVIDLPINSYDDTSSNINIDDVFIISYINNTCEDDEVFIW